jgi:hypothetical protein
MLFIFRILHFSEKLELKYFEMIIRSGSNSFSYCLIYCIILNVKIFELVVFTAVNSKLSGQKIHFARKRGFSVVFFRMDFHMNNNGGEEKNVELSISFSQSFSLFSNWNFPLVLFFLFQKSTRKFRIAIYLNFFLCIFRKEHEVEGKKKVKKHMFF